MRKRCLVCYREEGEAQTRGDYADHFAEEGKEEETAQEKRLRLAKQYLTELEEKGSPALCVLLSVASWQAGMWYLQSLLKLRSLNVSFGYALLLYYLVAERERRDWRELDREAIAHRLQHDVVSPSVVERQWYMFACVKHCSD